MPSRRCPPLEPSRPRPGGVQGEKGLSSLTGWSGCGNISSANPQSVPAFPLSSAGLLSHYSGAMSLSPVLLERQLKLYKGLVEVSALINAITESRELLPAILEVARRVMEVE